MFGEFGDFSVFKDTKYSCYIEFYYYDEQRVKNIEEVIEQVVVKKGEMGISEILPHKDAVKFKSHNRLD